MLRPYIGIEGPIGVGKTTLAQYLQPILQAKIMLEVYAENPFLAKFYESPDCYALQTQLFFLMNRYHQHDALDATTSQPLVSDYIFAKNDLFARYTLTGEEFTLYQEVSAALASRLVVPTMVVHLRGKLDTLMGRITKRGRDYEQRDDMRDYMAKLITQYDHFFADYKEAPVLTLNTDDLDIVEDERDRKKITERIVTEFKLRLADRPVQSPLL